MDIIIATNNDHKLKEYKEILNPLGINCLSLKDENIDVDPDEDGNSFAENSLIKLGLIGNLNGEVVLGFNHAAALGIVSKMVMMPVDIIDELGQSAISELGNMIAGNAATIFANSNIIIDITPPTYCLGSDYKDDGKTLFSIPFTSEVGDLSIDIYIEE